MGGRTPHPLTTYKDVAISWEPWGKRSRSTSHALSSTTGPHTSLRVIFLIAKRQLRWQREMATSYPVEKRIRASMLTYLGNHHELERHESIAEISISLAYGDMDE